MQLSCTATTCPAPTVEQAWPLCRCGAARSLRQAATSGRAACTLCSQVRSECSLRTAMPLMQGEPCRTAGCWLAAPDPAGTCDWVLHRSLRRPAACHLLAGHADLVAYGRPFIANPDLPLRFCLDAPLNPCEQRMWSKLTGHAAPFGVRFDCTGSTVALCLGAPQPL